MNETGTSLRYASVPCDGLRHIRNDYATVRHGRLHLEQVLADSQLGRACYNKTANGEGVNLALHSAMSNKHKCWA